MSRPTPARSAPQRPAPKASSVSRRAAPHAPLAKAPVRQGIEPGGKGLTDVGPARRPPTAPRSPHGPESIHRPRRHRRRRSMKPRTERKCAPARGCPTLPKASMRERSGDPVRSCRTSPEEPSSDSMLSRYFRDMATHQVMGPDEELQAAQAVERAEVDHWVALLAYLPVRRARARAARRGHPDRWRGRPSAGTAARRAAQAAQGVSQAALEVARAISSSSWTESLRRARARGAPARLGSHLDGERATASCAKRSSGPRRRQATRPALPETPAYRRYLERVQRDRSRRSAARRTAS